MSRRISICLSDGSGGAILGLQCAHYAELAGDKVTVFYPSNNRQYDLLSYFFPSVIQLPEYWQQNHLAERDFVGFSTLINEWGPFDDIYYSNPDLLFQNSHAFDWRRYKVHPQTIKSTRLLTDQWRPAKVIGAYLCSSTPGYLYPWIRDLLIQLANKFPDYLIYLPAVSSWAGHEISYGDLTNLPKNVVIDTDPDYRDALQSLTECDYVICADNGISHLSWNLGVPRLLLDPQYQRLAWQARWREDPCESVHINIPPDQLARIVELNVRQPISCLVPRANLANIHAIEHFNQEVFLKSI